MIILIFSQQEREGGKRNSHKNLQLLYGGILLDINIENEEYKSSRPLNLFWTLWQLV